LVPSSQESRSFIFTGSFLETIRVGLSAAVCGSERDRKVVDREALFRKVLFVFGLYVALVIRRGVQVARQGVGGLSERGEFLEREVEKTDVIGLERKAPAGF